MAFEFLHGFHHPSFQGGGRPFGVAVGPADGFGDDGVDDAQFEVVAGGEFEGIGGSGVGLLVGLLPEDGGAAFGADDAVPGVGQHGHAVGNVDGLGLAAFFGTDAGVGTGRVDEGDDGEIELLGDLHFGEGLAVALGVGAAKGAGAF